MPSDSSSPSIARRVMVMAIKLAVSVALLAWLFSRVDMAALWATARRASPLWMTIAFTIYAANVLLSVWRWWLLVEAQDLDVPFKQLSASMLVALFFNNFLPSNIGGDVIRISDTAKAAGSKTLATTIVLVDRTMGMMGLVLVAACGATMVAAGTGQVRLPLGPSWLWAGFLAGAAVGVPVFWSPAGVGRVLQPLTVVHPEWVGLRIDNVTTTLERFRNHPGALASCFGGAVLVQMATVAFHFAIVHALGIHIGAFDLAVAVPLAGVLQMLPVSVNGFGVREAAFCFYFSRIGLPCEQAILLSLSATALVMLFSLTGAAVYVARGRH
jgi:glycosyltransferase 2 family protein